MKGNDFFIQAAKKPPFTKLHPKVAAFFKDYLSQEKVIEFNGRYVLNTHFPPYPSPAFDNLVAQFGSIGNIGERRLYSVTLAVTNRCMYNCWHCYNAGRNQQDLSLPALKRVIGELQDFGAVRVTLSGGEPLLRDDLESIAGYFDDSTFLNLNTTGFGLTHERAKRLKDNGLFAVGVSIDSFDAEKHDRMRGKKGAFKIAANALEAASQSGLYPYIVSVATHEFLQPENFEYFIQNAKEYGALEVHLLEPCPTGKLAGQQDVVLGKQDRKRILDYQSEIAQDEDLPILSSFSYLESADAFGCGAGITHLYIDGNGEVSPCNLVPMSFGTIKNESLHEILGNMGKHFRTPRTGCIGHILSTHIPEGNLPTSPEISQYICGKYLPENHDVPRFFTIKADAEGEVGHNELKSAYNKVHGSYDEFWVTEAGKPVVELIDKLLLTGKEKVFEAGCGTGYATVRIAEKLDNPSQITAVDLSGGMLTEARGRAAKEDFNSIHFIEGDALDVLKKSQGYDVIFTSWVLGYIPLRPFWTAASKALGYNGRLAFIVHKENSPREPLEIFGELVAENPSILEKKVEFDFPPDMEYVQSQLKSAGLKIDFIGEGSVVFRYGTPEKVLDHLLKSGAGTAFYEAVVPSMRQEQERKFISIFRERNLDKAKFEVTHDYIICIARKRQ